MKIFVFILTLLAQISVAHAERTYMLTPHVQRPGQVVTIRSTSSSLNGKMIVVEDEKKKEGEVSIQRERVLERRVVSKGTSTGLSYKIIKDLSVSSNELGYEKNSRMVSPLTGKTAVGYEDNMGCWHLYIENQTATNREAVELVALEAYTNRRLFSPRPVKVGDSWHVNPAFFRHLVIRDMGSAQLKATMTFQAVQNIKGKSTAVIIFRLKTSGVKGDSQTQSAATATITATGTMLVTLDDMLDRELTIKGKLTTTAIQGENSTTAILPFNLKMTKTIAR